jgi:hypothetical protein
VQYELGFDQNLGNVAGSKLSVGFYDGTWRIVKDSVDIALNQWVHIAGTWDGTTFRLYKNGTQVNSGIPGGALPATNFDKVVLGKRHDVAGMKNFFPGLIDDARIYNQALSAAEIQALATVATPTPTPTPTACHQFTPTSLIPAGFGSPYDVLSTPTTNLMNVTCDVSSARVDLGKNDPLQYIYNTGYLFKTGGTNWTPFSHSSAESLIAGAWYPKTATATLSLTSTELSQDSYVLSYMCNWTGSGWKCGCRDSACTQSYWQIQQFRR